MDLARRLLLPALPLALVALTTAALPGGPAAAGNRTCFGQEPTIVDSGYILGTDGPDVILAGRGSEVHSLSGDDRVCGAFLVYAGMGDDRVWYAGDEVDVEIKGGPGEDRLFYLGGGLATLEGGDRDDVLRSGPGEQIIIGGGDRDDISAGKGDDLVYGRKGRDRIDGGPGRDRVDGGESSDRCLNAEDAVSCERG